MTTLKILVPTPHHLPWWRALMSDFKQYGNDLDAGILICGVFDVLAIERIDPDEPSDVMGHIVAELYGGYERVECRNCTDESQLQSATDDYMDVTMGRIQAAIEFYRPYSNRIIYHDITLPYVETIHNNNALLIIDGATLCAQRR